MYFESSYFLCNPFSFMQLCFSDCQTFPRQKQITNSYLWEKQGGLGIKRLGFTPEESLFIF